MSIEIVIFNLENRIKIQKYDSGIYKEQIESCIEKKDILDMIKELKKKKVVDFPVKRSIDYEVPEMVIPGYSMKISLSFTFIKE